MSRQFVPDRIDTRRDQWARELPDVDTTGMAILGRMRWLTLMARGPIERVFADHDLDAGEFDVLATLLRNGSPYELRPTELFQSLMISSGGLTPRLVKLGKAGLIRRRPAPEDARSLLVGLTDQGRTLVEAAFRLDMAVEAELIAGLSAAERRQLETLLRTLGQSVEARVRAAD